MASPAQGHRSRPGGARSGNHRPSGRNTSSSISQVAESLRPPPLSSRPRRADPRTLDSCLVTVRRLTSRRSARSSPTATPRTTRGRSSTPRPERTMVRGSAPPRRRPPRRTSPRSLRSRGALRPPRRTPWRTSPSSSPLRKSPLRPRGALWTAPLPSRPRGGADLDGFVSPPLSLT